MSNVFLGHVLFLKAGENNQWNAQSPNSRNICLIQLSWMNEQKEKLNWLTLQFIQRGLGVNRNPRKGF